MCLEKSCIILNEPDFVGEVKLHEDSMVYKHFEKSAVGIYFLFEQSHISKCVFDEYLEHYDECKMINLEYPPITLKTLSGYAYECDENLCYALKWGKKTAQQFLRPQVMRDAGYGIADNSEISQTDSESSNESKPSFSSNNNSTIINESKPNVCQDCNPNESKYPIFDKLPELPALPSLPELDNSTRTLMYVSISIAGTLCFVAIVRAIFSFYKYRKERNDMEHIHNQVELQNLQQEAALREQERNEPENDQLL